MAGWPRVRPRLLVKPAILAACLSASGCQSTFLTSAANAFGARISTLAMSETDERLWAPRPTRTSCERRERPRIPNTRSWSKRLAADCRCLRTIGFRLGVHLPRRNHPERLLPAGGKVVVYEGLLPVCENEAGLAVVMSHEIAHAIARHGAERMKEQAVVDAVGEVVSKSVSSQDEQRQLLLETAYGMGSKVGVLLPFSRAQETQADSIGLMLMAKAGYNPEEAPLFWRRFQTTGKGRTPELLSTHPADERRASQLIDLLPQAERFYAAVEQKLDRGSAIADLTNRTRRPWPKWKQPRPQVHLFHRRRLRRPLSRRNLRRRLRPLSSRRPGSEHRPPHQQRQQRLLPRRPCPVGPGVSAAGLGRSVPRSRSPGAPVDDKGWAPTAR